MNGISGLVKQTLECPLALCAMRGHCENLAACEPGIRSSLDIGLLAP